MQREFSMGFFAILTIATTVGGFLTGNSSSSEQDEPAANAAAASSSRQQRAAQLLFYEGGSCEGCGRFRDSVAPRYMRSSYHKKAPLTYVHVSRQGDGKYGLARQVTHTPTLVVVDSSGQELARQVGPPGNIAELFALLDRHL